MNDAFKPNGIRRKPTPSRLARKLVPVLSVLLLGSLLASCQTTGTGTTVTDNNGQCVAWRAITYSSKKDTPPTVKQVREHNATGKYLGCWK